MTRLDKAMAACRLISWGLLSLSVAIPPSVVEACSRGESVTASPLNIAKDAEGIYRGKIIEVKERQYATLLVTDSIKGPDIAKVQICLRFPIGGPGFEEGQEIIVGLDDLDEEFAQLWPKVYPDRRSYWPRPALNLTKEELDILDIDPAVHAAREQLKLEIEEADAVLRELLRFVEIDDFDERVTILSRMLRSSSTAVRHSAWHVVSLSTTRPNIAIDIPELFQWWRTNPDAKAADLLRVFLGELIEHWLNVSNLRTGAANMQRLGRTPLVTEGLVIMAGCLVDDDDLDKQFADIQSSFEGWSRKYTLPSGLTAALARRDKDDLPKLRVWARQLVELERDQRRDLLLEELKSDDPLTRAAARGEWRALFGEDPE